MNGKKLKILSLFFCMVVFFNFRTNLNQTYATKKIDESTINVSQGECDKLYKKSAADNYIREMETSGEIEKFREAAFYAAAGIAADEYDIKSILCMFIIDCETDSKNENQINFFIRFLTKRLFLNRRLFFNSFDVKNKTFEYQGNKLNSEILTFLKIINDFKTKLKTDNKNLKNEFNSEDFLKKLTLKDKYCLKVSLFERATGISVYDVNINLDEDIILEADLLNKNKINGFFKKEFLNSFDIVTNDFKYDDDNLNEKILNLIKDEYKNKDEYENKILFKDVGVKDFFEIEKLNIKDMKEMVIASFLDHIRYVGYENVKLRDILKIKPINFSYFDFNNPNEYFQLVFTYTDDGKLFSIFNETYKDFKSIVELKKMAISKSKLLKNLKLNNLNLEDVEVKPSVVDNRILEFIAKIDGKNVVLNVFYFFYDKPKFYFFFDEDVNGKTCEDDLSKEKYDYFMKTMCSIENKVLKHKDLPKLEEHKEKKKEDIFLNVNYSYDLLGKGVIKITINYKDYFKDNENNVEDYVERKFVNFYDLGKETFAYDNNFSIDKLKKHAKMIELLIFWNCDIRKNNLSDINDILSGTDKYILSIIEEDCITTGKCDLYSPDGLNDILHSPILVVPDILDKNVLHFFIIKFPYIFQYVNRYDIIRKTFEKQDIGQIIKRAYRAAKGVEFPENEMSVRDNIKIEVDNSENKRKLIFYLHDKDKNDNWQVLNKYDFDTDTFEKDLELDGLDFSSPKVAVVNGKEIKDARYKSTILKDENIIDYEKMCLCWILKNYDKIDKNKPLNRTELIKNMSIAKKRNTDMSKTGSVNKKVQEIRDNLKQRLDINYNETQNLTLKSSVYENTIYDYDDFYFYDFSIFSCLNRNYMFSFFKKDLKFLSRYVFNKWLFNKQKFEKVLYGLDEQENEILDSNIILFLDMIGGMHFFYDLGGPGLKRNMVYLGSLNGLRYCYNFDTACKCSIFNSPIFTTSGGLRCEEDFLRLRRIAGTYGNSDFLEKKYY